MIFDIGLNGSQKEYIAVDARVCSFESTKPTDRVLMNENCVHSTGRLNTNWIMRCILMIDIHTATSIASIAKSQPHTLPTFSLTLSVSQPDDFKLHTDLIGFGDCCCCYYYYTATLFSLIFFILFFLKIKVTGWGALWHTYALYEHLCSLCASVFRLKFHQSGNKIIL